jgi:hypothetical protein
MGMSQVSSFKLVASTSTTSLLWQQMPSVTLNPSGFSEFISQQCLNSNEIQQLSNVHFCLQTEIPFNQLHLWNPFSETKGMISVWWVTLRNIALTLQWHPQCSEKVYVPTCKMLDYQLPLLSTEGLVCLLTFRLVTKMAGKLYMQLSKQNLHMGVR